MVLAVCRQLLSDPNDVEDAFQATFLVLIRKGELDPATGQPGVVACMGLLIAPPCASSGHPGPIASA